LAASKTPGPGTYNNMTPSGAPAYSLAMRTKESQSQDSPGPGAYDPSVHSCVPAYSLAKRLDPAHLPNNPGLLCAPLLCVGFPSLSLLPVPSLVWAVVLSFFHTPRNLLQQ
jgi:hypothetical protein